MFIEQLKLDDKGSKWKWMLSSWSRLEKADEKEVEFLYHTVMYFK